MPQGQSFRIEASGLKQLVKDLRKTPARLDKAIAKANKAAVTKAVVPPVKRGAPRKSGRLQSSVRALATAQRAQLAVGSNVKVAYAGVINFGWKAHHIAPQEFIYKGIDEARDKILDVYIEEIDEAIAPLAPSGHL